jgi:hypothetical protein
MNILNALMEIADNVPPKDFYHSMTKYDRTAWSHPQEYGFHHHADKSQYHGVFATTDGRGKVFKNGLEDGSAIYSCEFDPENLLDKDERYDQILTAVKASNLSCWNYVNPSEFETCKDPCYTVVHSKTPGVIEIHVRQDFHPSVR